MSTVEIPASIAEAKSVLNGLGRLLTATEWERAAIVAAFVEKDAGNPVRAKGAGQRAGENPRVSASAFAKLGIIGLRDHGSVLRYEAAWREAGMRKPKPGQSVQLPTKAFPSEAAGTASPSGGRPRTSAGEIRDAVARGDKRVLDEIVEGVAESKKASVTDELFDAVSKKIGQTRRRPVSHQAELDDIFGPFIKLDAAAAAVRRKLPDFVAPKDKELREEALATADALEATADIIRNWVKGRDVSDEVAEWLEEVTQGE